MNQTNQGGETSDQPDDPQIYAASLADYNHGRLHGTWIAANQEPADIQVAIDSMLADSKLPDAEEWAIHDHQGFEGIPIAEHEPLERVARLAGHVALRGAAYGHWVRHVGTDDDQLLEQFDDHYLGHWDSTRDYADHVLADLGCQEAIDACVPAHLRPYVRIDAQGFARDLELSGDIWSHRDRTGVHIYAGQI